MLTIIGLTLIIGWLFGARSVGAIFGLLGLVVLGGGIYSAVTNSSTGLDSLPIFIIVGCIALNIAISIFKNF